jgi:hypothetical protein
MSEPPPVTGRIVIEWKRAPQTGVEPHEFAWEMRLEPPGLSDNDVANILREAAERL